MSKDKIKKLIRKLIKEQGPDGGTPYPLDKADFAEPDNSPPGKVDPNLMNKVPGGEPGRGDEYDPWNKLDPYFGANDNLAPNKDIDKGDYKIKVNDGVFYGWTIPRRKVKWRIISKTQTTKKVFFTAYEATSCGPQGTPGIQVGPNKERKKRGERKN